MTIVNLDRFKSRSGRTAPAADREWSPGAKRWIEVEAVLAGPARARRKQFQAQWVRFPLSWLVALRQAKSGYVWRLATEILFAEFRRQHTDGEIVLSEAATGLPHPARRRAIQTLVRLGLIEVEHDGRQAKRVTLVNLEMVASDQPDGRQRPT
jgi:hypothetical protein